MALFRRRRPEQLAYDAGWAAYEDGRYGDAVRLLEQALELAPSSSWAFDLGLMHKWQQQWGPSLAANLRAAELDPENTPACWNGGIAATALHDWPTARDLWQRYGVRLPDDGPGEPTLPIGHTPVRVDLDGGTEVVWCDRLDPARGRIENVPTPDCARAWHDVVLHDGEPKGERKLGEDWVPVFDEIALWRPSPVPRLQVEVRAAGPGDVADLERRFAEADRGAEDWTGSVQPLCLACSQGRPEQDHEHPVLDDWQERRPVGLGCEPDLAADLVAQWVAAAGDRRDAGPVERV